MNKRFVWVAFLGFASTALGCSDESPDNSGATPGLDAGTDAPMKDAEPPQDSGKDAEQPKPVRTLELRNPYGNVAAVDNLLIDGDFEFSDRDGQYGWLGFSNSSFGLDHETGGLCRSGVTCGRMPRNRRMIAYAP